MLQIHILFIHTLLTNQNPNYNRFVNNYKFKIDFGDVTSKYMVKERRCSDYIKSGRHNFLPMLVTGTDGKRTYKL